MSAPDLRDRKAQHEGHERIARGRVRAERRRASEAGDRDAFVPR